MAITFVRSKEFTTSSSRDIPVSVKEMVYGSKAGGVGTSSKILDKENELLPSSEEAFGHRNNNSTPEGMDTHVLQGTGLKDKSLVEKSKNFVRGSEERVGPKEGKQPSGRS
ncbi:hypothetical protein O181_122832 [Austropuccinia psidii MF-1]|uniref:Uncharacterized protein n=1 Tax=Austropuccinia psidii MF-1 TaxID=1389203 RepID=A0A9Q3Q4U8_9BASI|nr:hypothetical protein [Austropuccinia psidii MF-1]